MSSEHDNQIDYPLPLEPFEGPTPEMDYPETATLSEKSSGFSSPLRDQIAQAKRIVIKIGSSSLTRDDFVTSTEKIDKIVDAVCARMNV